MLDEVIHQSTRLRKVRALVVEDDPDARALIVRILADVGAQVSDAPDADAAMLHIKNSVPVVIVTVAVNRNCQPVISVRPPLARAPAAANDWNAARMTVA